MERLAILDVNNLVDDKGYSFMGNDSAFLSTITGNSFVILPYSGNSYIEYDFNGMFVDSHPRKIGNHFQLKLINDPNVVEIWQTTLKDEFNNRSEFEKLIDYRLPCIHDSDYQHEHWICGDTKLTRFWKWDQNDSHVLFIISSTVDNNIISAVHLNKAHYLDGDSGTHIYLLNGKNLLVHNDGDCPSVLLIKNNDPNAESSDPVPKRMMMSADNLKSCFEQYKQSIFDFIYSIIDDGEFGIYERKDGVRYQVENIYTRQRLMELTLSFNTIDISLYGGYTVKVDNISYLDVDNMRFFVKDAIKKLNSSDSESE